MNSCVKTLWTVLCLACLLPLSARAQEADPAVWGVYAQLLGAKLVSGKESGAIPYTWYLDSGKTVINEKYGATADRTTSQITSLGGGKLAFHINGSHAWTGTIEPGGAVVWNAESFLAKLAGKPYRVRLEGDVLVMEYVTLKEGRVTEARPAQRLSGSLANPAPAVAASPAETASAPSAAVQLAALPADEDSAATETIGAPRALSAQDLTKLRDGMTRDKLQRAETLRREQEQARQLEEMRRQNAEHQARMAQQAAQQQREEESDSSSGDAFFGALLGGLNTLQSELAKNQVQQAKQAAFVANLQRQQAEATAQRQREAERQRQQAAAQQQLARQQTAATQQQGQTVVASNTNVGLGGRSLPAVAPEPSKAEIAERELRERAAVERQRQQQLREQALAAERVRPSTPLAATPATQMAQAGTNPAPQASCKTVTNTLSILGRNKTEELTRADINEKAARSCQGKGSLGAVNCSSTRDISIDSHGKQHDLGTRTYECVAVLSCGTREYCGNSPAAGSAQ
jgi:hypothetical protein